MLCSDDLKSSKWFPLDDVNVQTLAGMTPYLSDFVVRNAPLQVLHMEATPMGGGGSPVNALITIADITRQHELNEAKDDLVTTVSHELRTPLSILDMFLSNMHAGVLGEMNERVVLNLDRAKNASRRLAILIDGLLEYSRVRRGVVHIDVGDASISEIIKEVCEIFDARMVAKERHFSVSENVRDDHFNGDAQRLHQVISNLLDNATKFTKEGGVISLAVSDDSENIRFEVSDDGIGVAVEDSERVFEQFTQIGREYGPGSKGLGLGLALCKGGRGGARREDLG